MEKLENWKNNRKKQKHEKTGEKLGKKKKGEKRETGEHKMIKKGGKMRKRGEPEKNVEKKRKKGKGKGGNGETIRNIIKNLEKVEKGKRRKR